MKKILIFASFLALASPIFTQQVNPNTQIGWPTNCSTPGYVYSYQAKLCIPGGGGGNQVSVAAIAGPFVMAGTQQLFDAIPSVTPVCDPRTQGMVVDGATPIDSAVQACVNLVNSKSGGTGIVLLPCALANSVENPGCFWNDPAALTQPPGGGGVKFVLQGTLGLGSTLVAPYWENWFGDGGGGGNQFQKGLDGVVATIRGPTVNGTIGTAITTAPSTAVTVTPTFTNGSIANLPPGSAITIAGTTSSTATATRTALFGYGKVVLTTARRNSHSARRTYHCHWLLGFNL